MYFAVIYFLLLSNCVLVIRGFSLRNCFLSEDNRAFCNQHRLRSVPIDIPPTVMSIDLSNNDISKIQVSNFTHFPNLTSLDLKQNSISSIGKHTFSQLVSLLELKLSRNKLTRLEDDVFDGLSKLIELRLDFNRIQKVAPNAFRSLSSLTLLELSNNKLRSIAQVYLAIQHMPKLQDLAIRNNSITTFRSQDLTNISTEIMSLDVSKNPLVMFEVTADVFPKLYSLNIGNPTVMSSLTWAVQNSSLLCHVTALDISGVQLASINEWTKLFTTFQSSVTFLKLNMMRHKPALLIKMACSILKLSILQIQTSTLSSTQSELFQKCRRISSIDLQGNNILENSSFGALYSLHSLNLCNNKLRSVPPATSKLKSLQTLDLSLNRIKIVRCQDFSSLRNLKELRLQKNRITELNKCHFYNLNKLEFLNLQGNQIFNMGKAFHKLPNLKVLNLNHNKLTAVRFHAFIGLRSLENISLAENQIQILEAGSFSGVTNLMFLHLQSNELNSRTLHKGVFKDVKKLQKLFLQNNHIKYSSSHLNVPLFMNLSHLDTLVFDQQTVGKEGIMPSNFLQGLTSLLTFSCKSLHLGSLSDDFFIHTPLLKTLDISDNDFHNMSSSLFAPIPNLKQLKIQNSNLPSLDFLINANLTKLKALKAPRNSFSVMNEDIIRSLPSLRDLYLIPNSFLCDCANSWFVKWIKNNNLTQVEGAYSLTCNYPQRYKNTKLLDLNVQSCLVEVGFICFISTSCVNIVFLVASFTFNFSRFQLTYTYYLFLAWLYDSRNRQKRAACRYDAFVSYNAHDEAWVYRELVPHLEQEQGWRLCLHHRDFLPGKPIVENIAEAIYGSRKTLCVISHRYLQSEWCSKEMQLASFRLFDEREDVLILVFLEDIPSSHLSPYYRMKKLLRKQSYLSWPRAAQHPQLFWEKLRQALRSTNTEEEERLRLTVNN